MVISNTNSISVTFTISCVSGTTTQYISVRNLSVVGYKNGTTSGIKESLDLNKTNVWVNSNKIFFKNLDDKKLKMNIFNFSGQLVMEDNNPKPETEINLETGVYTIQLLEDNKVIYNKKVQITP